MLEQLTRIRESALERLKGVKTEEELEELNTEILGRNGALTAILRSMGKLSPEERAELGKSANAAKQALIEAIGQRRSAIAELMESIKNEREIIDVTLPGLKASPLGRLNPLTKVYREIRDALIGLGFTTFEGPEIEYDDYNFTKLNLPLDHPARDMQDTFYIDERTLLRTHTSPCEARALMTLKPPFRLVIPGRVFRVDEPDASHSPVFMQMEGLVVDKDLTFADTTVRILSALNDESKAQVEALAEELCKDYLAQQDSTANKNDLTALFNIGYGLYVVTSNDGVKDNGLIVNTVSQVTNTPNRVAVTINKQNYSHHVIKQSGVMNVNCLDVSAPFSVFQNFGFQSGRTADKFAGIEELRSDNGLRFLPRYINSFMSLKVESYVDLGTHGMFICSVTEARVMGSRETMSYTYYQNNVKPKPQVEGKKGFVCKVCGWVYEGDTLPDDIVCPLCKHGAADFEPIK